MRAQAEMPPDRLAATFAALGDARRVAIVARLQEEGSLSLTEICVGSTVSRQAMRKHLTVLTKAQLVAVEKSGRETWFHLEIERMRDANRFLQDVAAKWDASLGRLKAQLEG